MFNFVQDGSVSCRFQVQTLFNHLPSMHHRRPYQLPSPAAPVPLRLPAGIDVASILARQTAMINAGTHPTLAERLALSASENQAMRDRDPRFTARPEDPF